ncbi:hypothetical protein PHYC_01623 [Phycisphaerales bacterium]|nr:hypothetical protein PHYC_01623 [Phycisphaerales bacterium]
MNERELIQKWWGEAWSEGLWAAAWSKSLEGLSPQQAAWAPPSAPGVDTKPGDRHSIWQIVLHMVFWRESWLKRVAGGGRHTDEEYARLNFPDILIASEAAWEHDRRRFKETQDRVGAAFADGKTDHSAIMYLLPHDCYHFGQINYLRAMQGLRPIE